MHVGLRQSGEAEGHPGFKSFRRGAEVRAKRPPRADDLLAMLMCCGAFASRMFLFCDLSCHLFTLACQAYAALALLRCCISCVCERVGLSGRWVCGLVSSPAVVPVRCLRAVKKVESSRVDVGHGPSGSRGAWCCSPAATAYALWTCRTPNTSSGTRSLRSGQLAAGAASWSAPCLEQLLAGYPCRCRVFAPIDLWS